MNGMEPAAVTSGTLDQRALTSVCRLLLVQRHHEAATIAELATVGNVIQAVAWYCRGI